MNRFIGTKVQARGAVRSGTTPNTWVELAFVPAARSATKTEHGDTYVLMSRLRTEEAIIQAAEAIKREIEVARDQALALLKS